MAQTKTCWKCGKRKSIEQFSKNVRAKDGLLSTCKPCEAERLRAYHANKREAHREYQKAYYRAHKDRTLEYMKTWYTENREDQLVKKRKYRERRKNYLRDNQVLKRYGVTRKEYEQIKEQQNNSCAICFKSFNGDSQYLNACIDHDHATNQTRGLLCQACNRALGMLKDSPALCHAAADYLDLHFNPDEYQFGGIGL